MHRDASRQAGRTNRVTTISKTRQRVFSHSVSLGALPLDPLELIGRDGIFVDTPGLTLAGWGSVAEPRLPGGLEDETGRQKLRELLRGIVANDEIGRLGSGPIALGAFPFDRSAEASLRIPSILIGVAGDQWWATSTGNEDRRPSSTELGRLIQDRLEHVAAQDVASPSSRPDLARDRRRLGLAPAPQPVQMTAHPGPQQFASLVARAVDEINAGKLQKVVLGRCVDLEPAGDIHPVRVLRRLRRREPTTTAFLVPTSRGHFLGATPELIVACHGRRVLCHPLAGTTGLTEDPEDPSATPTGRLLGSDKELQEHRLVVQAIAEVLHGWCDQLVVPEHPEVLRLGTDARLSTRIEGLLASRTGPAVLDLLSELHPTPAVGGVPRSDALAFISGREEVGRGYWAGPVGWTNAAGDGEWVLGIRSVTLENERARVWAGAGIVRASDPQAELEETTLKLEPVIAALSPDNPTT